MSLHAKPSAAALSALEAQKRNASISSLLIALLLCSLICVILTFVFLKSYSKSTLPLIGIDLPQETEIPMDPPTVSNKVQTRPPSAPASVSRVITAPTTSPISVSTSHLPKVGLTFAHSAGNGDGSEFCEGGPGGRDTFKPLQGPLSKRCSKQDRLARLSTQGGTPECEDAVILALRQLQKTQNKDGSWTNSKPVAMTGLALLAYLGHCETPNSAEFGQTVLDAITYLTTIGLQNDGTLASNFNDKHWPYEHAIATYALAEAYTFCDSQNLPIPNLKQVVQQAGNHIINSQHARTGAWDYTYDTTGPRGGDSSITCWHLQALKACTNTGIEFKNAKRTALKALAYLEKCQKENGGIYYTPAGGSLPSMTGGAILCFQQWGRGSRSTVRNALRFARTVAFDYDSLSADLYAHYYYSQAMINRGGNEWKSYNAKFRDQILNNQNPDGSWTPPGGGNKINAVSPTYASGPYATHYRTCLNTLMLEVYYRFLPTQ